ncbi:hypothetical protein AURDEDRAFT_128829 [Auricularia subglabra TFB-10046 SS5]|nr:hypothetical protein AURDEDRAFT_128829 [Auricularia subglabra TFB-10046 SS5]
MSFSCTLNATLWKCIRGPPDAEGRKGYNVYEASVLWQGSEMVVNIAHQTVLPPYFPGTVARLTADANLYQRSLLLVTSRLIAAPIQPILGIQAPRFHLLPRVNITGVVSVVDGPSTLNPNSISFVVTVSRKFTFPVQELDLACVTNRDEDRLTLHEPLTVGLPVRLSGIIFGWSRRETLLIDVHTLEKNYGGSAMYMSTYETPNPFEHAVFPDGFAKYPASAFARTRERRGHDVISRSAPPTRITRHYDVTPDPCRRPNSLPTGAPRDQPMDVDGSPTPEAEQDVIAREGKKAGLAALVSGWSPRPAASSTLVDTLASRSADKGYESGYDTDGKTSSTAVVGEGFAASVLLNLAQLEQQSGSTPVSAPGSSPAGPPAPVASSSARPSSDSHAASSARNIEAFLSVQDVRDAVDESRAPGRGTKRRRETPPTVMPRKGLMSYASANGSDIPVTVSYRFAGPPIEDGMLIKVVGTFAFKTATIRIGALKIQIIRFLGLNLTYRFSIRLHFEAYIQNRVDLLENDNEKTLAFTCAVYGPAPANFRCSLEHADRHWSKVPVIYDQHKVTIVGDVCGQADGIISVKITNFAFALYPAHIVETEVIFNPIANGSLGEEAATEVVKLLTVVPVSKRRPLAPSPNPVGPRPLVPGPSAPRTQRNVSYGPKVTFSSALDSSAPLDFSASIPDANSITPRLASPISLERDSKSQSGASNPGLPTDITPASLLFPPSGNTPIDLDGMASSLLAALQAAGQITLPAQGAIDPAVLQHADNVTFDLGAIMGWGGSMPDAAMGNGSTNLWPPNAPGLNAADGSAMHVDPVLADNPAPVAELTSGALLETTSPCDLSAMNVDRCESTTGIAPLPAVDGTPMNVDLPCEGSTATTMGSTEVQGPTADPFLDVEALAAATGIPLEIDREQLAEMEAYQGGPPPHADEQGLTAAALPGSTLRSDSTGSPDWDSLPLNGSDWTNAYNAPSQSP